MEKAANMKSDLMKNKLVVCLLAVLCCLLWGSAFPSIKIGYKIFEIGQESSMSQVLFAGTRFFLAGILAIVFGSILQKKFLFPKKLYVVEAFLDVEVKGKKILVFPI